MATIIERDIHHSDAGADSSAMAIIVTIVALVVIAGAALFFFRVLPARNAAPANGGININAEIPTGQPTPDSTNY